MQPVLTVKKTIFVVGSLLELRRTSHVRAYVYILASILGVGIIETAWKKKLSYVIT
jgi:hypothetical protein